MIARWLVVAGVVVTLAVAAGCRSGDSSDPSTPAPSPPASTTLSPRATAERDAVAAYVGMWQAMAKAGEVPDPDAPELRQFAAERALARIVDVIFTYRETGVVTRGGPVANARATSASPAEAPTEITVADCGDSTNWTKHKKATGEPIKDDLRGRRNITAVVKIVNGSWKVVSFDVGDIGSC